MVDQTKVETSEAKAIELEKKVQWTHIKLLCIHAFINPKGPEENRFLPHQYYAAGFNNILCGQYLTDIG